MVRLLKRHGPMVAYVVVALVTVIALLGIEERKNDAIVRAQRAGCERTNVLRAVLHRFIQEAVVARTRSGDLQIAAGYRKLGQQLVDAASEFPQTPGSALVDCDAAYREPS